MRKAAVTPNWHTPCWGNPPIFRTDQDAIQWAIGQGAFPNEAEATAAFTALQARQPYGTWAHWLTAVARRLLEQGKGAAAAQPTGRKGKTLAKPT